MTGGDVKFLILNVKRSGKPQLKINPISIKILYGTNIGGQA